MNTLKKINKVLFIILLLATAISLTACGEESTPSDPPVVEKEKYTINYANTSIESATLEEGTQISQPRDPEKDNYIFMGWYEDASFTKEVKFPFALTKNTTVYAKYNSYMNAYQEARNNTIGTNVEYFEYEYKTVCSIKYNSLELSGETDGIAKYSKGTEISYYDVHTNSGALFFDGNTYLIKKNTQLQTIKTKSDGTVTKVKMEEVGQDYKYDTTSFAKAVFSFSDSDINSIEKTDKQYYYKLNTKTTTTNILTLIANNINNNLIQSVIGNLPLTSANTIMLVSFYNGKINTYSYNVTVNTAGIELSLDFNLEFKNVNNKKTIVPDLIAGLSITNADIESINNEIVNTFSSYESKTKTGYDFVFKTALGFSDKNDINSTFQGSALRKVDGAITYFHNDIEIDTDYKNADVYKSAGIADVHIKKTKLANGEVWLIEKKSLIDGTTQVNDYSDNYNDLYYLFGVYNLGTNYSYIQKLTNNKDGSITYSLGINNDIANKLLTWINDNIDIDPLNKASIDVKVFGDFSNLVLEDSDFTVTVLGGDIKEVILNVEGTLSTSLSNSRDFTQNQNATFSVSLKLTENTKAQTYEPFATVKDAK